jgi:peptide/nickel transport system substrate-binding protein
MRVRSLDKRLILGFVFTVVIAVALACGAAEQPTQQPATPRPAAPPAPAAPVPVAPTQAPAAPAAPAPAPTAAPAPTVVQIAPTAVPAQPAPTARPAAPPTAKSTGLTFWSDLAAKCEKRGGHLKLGNRITEFSNLNPATINQVIQFSITAEVLSGLIQLDPELKPHPDLAKSWEISPDLLTYTFKLRENAKFHDGRPLTADDWVYTYDHTLDPKTQSIHTKGLEGVNRPVKIDDYTLSITTQVPRASFLTKVVERSSGRVMTLADKEYIAKNGEGGFNRKPHGAGPFKVTDHVFGERLELEAARGTYYDSSVPCLDRITMYNIGEWTTLISALLTKQVDIVYEYAPQFYEQLSKAPGVVIDDTPDVGFQHLRFNVRADREAKVGLKGKQPWDDQRVVQALGKSLDRAELIKRAFQGRAIPGYGPIPPGQKFYFEDLSKISAQAYDPSFDAKKAMADYGYPNGWEVKVQSGVGDKVQMEVLADLWKKSANVTMIPDFQEAAVYQPRSAAGEFAAQIGGSGGDPDPDDSIDDWFAAGSKFNHVGFDDAIINDLNLQQKTQPDPVKRKEIIIKLNRRLSEVFPGVFLYHYINSTPYNDYVKGYVPIQALRQFSAVWLNK